MSIEEKIDLARRQIRSLESVIIAYSGGLDSALVMKLAADELGDRALAVTADSPSIPRHELQGARELAVATGIRHVVVASDEMADERYAANPADRCYYCKGALYRALTELARRESFACIANGTNLDDLGDYRPGLQAASEFTVESPLRDAGFTKDDVREAARLLGLPVWDKPASPCLASRIPYGSKVTAKKLKMVEDAEVFMHDLGYREVRVRHFGAKARVEVPESDMARAQEHLGEIVPRLREIGFLEVDLVVFKSGALNAALGAGVSPVA